MTIVQSVGQLADVSITNWYPSHVYRSVQLYDQYYYEYATLYRTQPNVRVCVDFLARNIAQLGLHVFRRVSETDRQRLRDHPLARLIEQPLPPQFKMTRYRLIESLMGDLGIYHNAFWLKVRVGGKVQGLLRVPPTLVTVYGSLVPTKYEIDIGGEPRPFQPEDIVHFRGYNPEDPTMGLSPLETLRRILAEEHAAGDYREHFWRNAARMHGIILRPADAPDWSPAARERFKEEFAALYSGAENSGKTAILEEGMDWKAVEFNAQESEYLAGRKLTREECARAYHIPLPMVGILDHATFSNIKEQHKQLYQDSLGPWLATIEQDIELQLLPEFEDREGVYVEFNIQEKLQGSFEEQTQALQSAVGRPWMTADEARARMNLPSMGGDAAVLVTPLNVMVGGLASPRDTAPKALGALDVEAKAAGKAAGEVDPTLPELRARYTEQWTRLLVRTFERQRAAVMSKLKARLGAETKALELAVLWDEERWNREVSDDFYRLGVETAMTWARYVAKTIGLELDEDEMLPWLKENARVTAEYTNATTRRQVEAALREDDPGEAVRHVFELAVGVRAAQFASSRVNSLANFGSLNAARQGGLRHKTWHAGPNPRPSHAAQDGMTVGIREAFPNGLRWPGDPRGDADENANCNCTLTYGP